MNLRWTGGADWALTGRTRAVRRGARAAGAPNSLGGQLGAELRRAGVEIAIEENVVPRARRGLERPALDFAVDCASGERAVTILRHPSGATTFHSPVAAAKTRGRGPAATSLQFRIELAAQAPLRRGLISTAIKVIVVKVREKLIDAAVSAGLHAAALGAEKLWWRQRKLSEGWHAIAPAAAGGIRLNQLRSGDASGKRALLFLHGTFSDTVGSFGALLKPKILAALRDLYEDRIFGYEHFSVSRTPEENARMLLDFLPDRAQRFDVVAYSRGGLFLRTLTEQTQNLGALGRRFRVDHGVLVAVPNGGTPLATGQRWEDTFGLLSTLLDLVPDSPLTPLTTAAAFIADGIVWLAGHLAGDLPGLEAMDAESAAIGALQQRGATPFANYSAIGANYQPSASIWQKLLDGGIDGFFAGANDLVVPSDGALAVDPGTPRVIPDERVACFGPGGNLRPNAGDVHHLSILAQDETAAFVLRALRDEKQNLPALNFSSPLPSRRVWRGGGAPAAARPSRARGGPPPADEPSMPQPSSGTPVRVGLPSKPDEREGDSTLHLMVVSDSAGPGGRDPNEPPRAQIIAVYGSARVVEPFGLRNPAGVKNGKGAGTRFSQIIVLDQRIQMSLEGLASKRTGTVPELPDGESLRQFGQLLFETLFTPRVRRLYDLARSEQRGAPLNVVFTCTIPWVAAKPWEFSFDADRRKFLATEEIHFVRNVLTAVPAQRRDGDRETLRVLVVEAQPAGTAELALDEEERQIRFRFQPLIDTGLVEIDVLARATPQRLHDMIVSRNLEKSPRPYDIVHFMGHGEFDQQDGKGRLLFYDQPVGIQSLRELLCNRGLQLVFLNACDTARDSNQQLNRSVAAALVEGGLPAVVANQYKVLDPSAVAFAQEFYWALANGATLGQAAREARIAVNCSIDGEIIDWAVPVLYARYPDRRLCAQKSAPVAFQRTVPRAGQVAEGRTMTGQRGSMSIIVGVADLARYFTGLEEILARLNAVQQRFVFRLVEVNTPMGVWEHDPEENITYLYAERFAQKLRNKPRTLGVDLLGCITNWWMRDDETLNIYGWWSGDADVPVLIFSTAGLALPTLGFAAGRVVANELVCGIAAQLAGANANLIHENPPEDCPFFYNSDRSAEAVAGRLRISPASRAKLMKTLPKAVGPRATLAAFNAMLGAFDPDFADTVQAPGTSKIKASKARTARKKNSAA